MRKCENPVNVSEEKIFPQSGKRTGPHQVGTGPEYVTKPHVCSVLLLDGFQAFDHIDLREPAPHDQHDDQGED